MAIPFSGILTPQSVAFTGPDGKMHNVTSAHPCFEEMRQTMRALQQAISANDPQASSLHDKLAAMAEPAKALTVASGGSVSVRDGIVLYKDEPVHNAVVERIIGGLKDGFDMKPYMLFLENLMENPSKRAVDELYRFVEKNAMGITADGYLLAYKKVREDYTDIHSGTFNNSPGCVVEMARNQVDDQKDRTCSAGLHFCSFAYLPHFGSGPGNRIVIVKVNPRDVVSIPSDYDCAKARCCRYEVIGEYDGADKDDILARRGVWSVDDTRKHFGDYGDDSEGDDEEEDFDEDNWGDDPIPYDEDEEEDEDEDDDLPDDPKASQAPPAIIAAVSYRTSFDGTIQSAHVTTEDGSVVLIIDAESLVRLSERLAEQASQGRKARVTMTVLSN